MGFCEWTFSYNEVSMFSAPFLEVHLLNHEPSTLVSLLFYFTLLTEQIQIYFDGHCDFNVNYFSNAHMFGVWIVNFQLLALLQTAMSSLRIGDSLMEVCPWGCAGGWSFSLIIHLHFFLSAHCFLMAGTVWLAASCSGYHCFIIMRSF